MTRLATGAIALLLVQVLACEEVPIPLDPTSVDETPRESFQGPPPPSPSPASEVPPPANPDSTYAITSSPDHLSVSPFAEAPCSTAGRAEGDECIFPCGRTAAVR